MLPCVSVCVMWCTDLSPLIGSDVMMYTFQVIILCSLVWGGGHSGGSTPLADPGKPKKTLELLSNLIKKIILRVLWKCHLLVSDTLYFGGRSGRMGHCSHCYKLSGPYISKVRAVSMYSVQVHTCFRWGCSLFLILFVIIVVRISMHSCGEDGVRFRSRRTVSLRGVAPGTIWKNIRHWKVKGYHPKRYAKGNKGNDTFLKPDLCL